MRLPVLLMLAPVILSSCAALNSIVSDEPTVDSAGPLVLGSTYSVNGVIDGGTVSASFPVKTFYALPNGRGTVSPRDSIAALDAGTPGFVSASYLTAPSPSLNFLWLNTSEGLPSRYECLITTTLQAPYTGVLTLRRGGNTYTGTCSVTSS